MVITEKYNIYYIQFNDKRMFPCFLTVNFGNDKISADKFCEELSNVGYLFNYALIV